MKIAIMQPYFLPYIGYFQLMNAVEDFVIYDNIEYTKKGWINRNRILINGKDEYISLPLKSASDFLPISERSLADTWEVERKKMLNRIAEAYRKAPFFSSVFPLLERILLFNDTNLFKFLKNSLLEISNFLKISTRISVSSSISIDHKLKGEEKVIAICQEKGGKVYINPIGGLELYSRDNFKEKGIELFFLKATNIQYTQYKNEFVPWLSIADVLMFNEPDLVQEYLRTSYSLI